MNPDANVGSSIPEYPEIANHIRQAIDEVYYGVKEPSEALDDETRTYFGMVIEQIYIMAATNALSRTKVENWFMFDPNPRTHCFYYYLVPT